jgi:hypothetical protein
VDCPPARLPFNHKVRIYKEYHSVSPHRNWDSLPSPFSPASVPLPPEPKGGGGHTRLRVRGWGSLNSDDWRKLSTLPTLRLQHNISSPLFQENKQLRSGDLLQGAIKKYPIANNFTFLAREKNYDSYLNRSLFFIIRAYNIGL